MATSKIKSNANYASGTWTPHLYDNNTKVAELSEQNWYRVGPLYVMPVYIDSMPESTFNTMLQIRNLPCERVLGGSLYIANAEGKMGDRTVQSIQSSRVFFRPNITGSFNGGVFSALIFGM